MGSSGLSSTILTWGGAAGLHAECRRRQGIVPRMQALATPVLALIRAAEGWSVWNVCGALLLGTVVVGLIAYAVLVTLRR